MDDRRTAVVAPQVSFIVPVRNDAARLDVCLSSIRKNSTPDHDVEIVVVDNGSTDESPAVARRHGATVLSVPHGRVSALRNLGAARARGEILAFVDADNELAAGWVAAALGNFGESEIGAAGALYVPPSDGTWVQQAYGRLRGRSKARQATDWLGSGNLAVKRPAFDAVRGFDTTLEACEDVDFCLRLRARGLTLLSDPLMGSVHHGDPKTLRALFVGELWRGRDNLKVSFRRPVAWAGAPSALMPVVDLLMLATVLLGVVTLAAGRPSGVLTITSAVAVIGLGAAARTWRALRAERTDLVNIGRLYVVVVVYNLARALAVVMKTPHRHAHRAVAAVSS